MLHVAADQIALFLDFDGTLVDLAPTPDSILVEDRIAPTLIRLSDALDGAIAIVTGRELADVDGHLKLKLPAAGLHGMQYRPHAEAQIETIERPSSLDHVMRLIRETIDFEEGLFLEDKALSFGVHYRACPDKGPMVKQALGDALTDFKDLHVISGKMLFEVKPRHINKGHAVGRFLEEEGFKGRMPVFVGDDVTDEDGFRAAAHAGGFGVKVGAGPTSAQHRLHGVSDVVNWLNTLRV